MTKTKNVCFEKNGKHIMRFAITGIAVLSFFLCGIGRSDEIVIRPLGKVDASSTNGIVQLDLFYVAASTNRMSFDQYWIAKPNSHQALVTPSSNNIVDLGDRLCCLKPYSGEISIFTGVTNIANPLSAEDIRQYFTPIFERIHEYKSSGISWKSVNPVSLLPPNALSQRPPFMGTEYQINSIIVTATNMSLEIQTLDPSGQNKKRAILVFGKDLDVLEAHPIESKEQNKTNNPIVETNLPSEVPPLRRGHN